MCKDKPFATFAITKIFDLDNEPNYFVFLNNLLQIWQISHSRSVNFDIFFIFFFFVFFFFFFGGGGGGIILTCDELVRIRLTCEELVRIFSDVNKMVPIVACVKIY